MGQTWAARKLPDQEPFTENRYCTTVYCTNPTSQSKLDVPIIAGGSDTFGHTPKKILLPPKKWAKSSGGSSAGGRRDPPIAQIYAEGSGEDSQTLRAKPNQEGICQLPSAIIGEICGLLRSLSQLAQRDRGPDRWGLPCRGSWRTSRPRRPPKDWRRNRRFARSVP